MDVADLTFGVDLYSGQGNLSVGQWGRLRQENGICFAICKATGEGQYFNGSYFPNRDAVRALNAQVGSAAIQWGSYDWFEPSQAGTREGAFAAREYLDAIGQRDPGHLLMVDFESEIWHTGPLGRNIEPFCKEYFLTLSDLSEQLVGVYAGPYFFTETGAVNWTWLGDPSRFFFWIAAPGANQQAADDVNWPGRSLMAPFTDAVIHQHQWHSHFAATGGTEWDKNRFRGTPNDLLAYGYQAATTAAQKDQTMVPLPPDSKWSEGVTAAGVPYVIWNVGGRTTGFDGVAMNDVGASVYSFTEPGMILDRTVRDGVVLPYNPPRPKV